VQWRKTSYGTDSLGGSQVVESLLTVVTTCRQQGRNPLDYLTACCQAFHEDKMPPSLLPVTAPVLSIEQANVQDFLRMTHAY
jgi:hypothetical protein